MSVGEFCSRDVVVAEKNTSIAAAAKLMRQHHVGNVIVVEQRDGLRIPVGILTDRDLVMEVLAKDVSVEACTVGDIMSFDLVTAKETDGIWNTLQRMRARSVRRIPVVSGTGALVGILSADDLLELLSEELSNLAKIIGHQPDRERALRQ